MAISTIDQTGLNAPLTLTSPVLTTPNLGTPSALVLTNATALPASAMASGTVIQTVSVMFTTQVGITSASYVTTGFSATITPQFSTSKILVLISSTIDSSSGKQCTATIYRNGSDIVGNRGLFEVYSGVEIQFPMYAQYLDSPATTSSLTYTIYGRAFSNQGQTFYISYDNCPTIITLQEIR